MRLNNTRIIAEARLKGLVTEEREFINDRLTTVFEYKKVPLPLGEVR
jgi:hypothetical protein